MSRWYTLGRLDLEAFLVQNDEIHKVKNVEVVFEDDVPTEIIVELEGGMCLNFSAKRLDAGGRREELLVSLIEESK